MHCHTQMFHRFTEYEHLIYLVQQQYNCRKIIIIFTMKDLNCWEYMLKLIKTFLLRFYVAGFLELYCVQSCIMSSCCILFLDFKRFILKIYVHICYTNVEIRYYWKRCHLKRLYDVLHWTSSVPSLARSLSLTRLFLNEIMKTLLLNKIVCSVLKNFSAMIIFSF
jgi:hypothetical protein